MPTPAVLTTSDVTDTLTHRACSAVADDQLVNTATTVRAHRQGQHVAALLLGPVPVKHAHGFVRGLGL